MKIYIEKYKRMMDVRVYTKIKTDDQGVHELSQTHKNHLNNVINVIHYK